MRSLSARPSIEPCGIFLGTPEDYSEGEYAAVEVEVVWKCQHEELW